MTFQKQMEKSLKMYLRKDTDFATALNDLIQLTTDKEIQSSTDSADKTVEQVQKSEKEKPYGIYEEYLKINENYAFINLPPPPSPLLKAYYGSTAYEDKYPPEEIDLDEIFLTNGKVAQCPQITGGSNPKSVHYNPYNNKCILVKKQNNGQCAIEVFASQIHRAMGMYAPDMRWTYEEKRLFSPLIDPKYQQASPTEIEHIIKFVGDKFDDLKQQIVDLYIVSCWIANWDVWGLSGDNTLISKKGDKSILACIDLGGAFMFSAMGGAKDEKGWKPLWFEENFENVVKRMNAQMLDMVNDQYSAGKYFRDLAYGESANQGIFNKGSKLNKMAKNTCTRALMLMHPDYDYISLLLEWSGIADRTTSLGSGVYNTVIYSYFKTYHTDNFVDINKTIRDWLFYRILAIRVILNE